MSLVLIFINLLSLQLIIKTLMFSTSHIKENKTHSYF